MFYFFYVILPRELRFKIINQISSYNFQFLGKGVDLWHKFLLLVVERLHLWIYFLVVLSLVPFGKVFGLTLIV